MAGLIARLFGGKTSPAVDMEPAPGIGGVTLGAGPANQSGFPGSTSQTRTFPSNGRTPNSPRSVKIRADYDTDANSRSGSTPEVRQVAKRGDIRGASLLSPRQTPSVVLPQTVIRQEMQHNSDAEFFGGPALTTGFGNNTAGGEPLSPAQYNHGHSAIDTTTPLSRAPVPISGDVPGSENVRNTIAERYKNKPGDIHTYQSAPRADQATVNPGGQATDGNVHAEAVRQTVSVPNRYAYDGFTSWAVTREMPYAGRGDGARGADLNGQRYYATGQTGQFLNGGQGEYGIARQRGSKRPVGFIQPAPWTANVYDTTDSVGTTDNPNASPDQQPSAIYYSPGGLRASNGTGRTG